MRLESPHPFIADIRSGPLKNPGATRPGDRLPNNATHPSDPQQPDDDFMGNGSFLIFKLPEGDI